MAYFHTCQNCAAKPSECATRAKLSAAISGLGVGSIKHRCPAFVPLYTPGAAVLVQTRAWLSKEHPDYHDDDHYCEPPMYWYRGHFIRYAGPKLLVFVRPGTIPEDSDAEYAEEDALQSGNGGMIKAPRARVKPSDWSEPVSVGECRWCAAITTLGQPCGRDPNYTPASSCQAHLLALASTSQNEAA